MIIIYKKDAPSTDDCHLLMAIPDINILEEIGEELYAGVRNDPVVSYKDRVGWFAVPEQHLPPPEMDEERNEIIPTIGELNLTYYTADSLPKSQHIAKLKAVHPPPAIRPATVTRKFMGKNYNVDCFVTQTVRDEYEKDKISIGDYVTVSFISEYPDGEEKDIALVTGKVFKSW